MSNQEEKIICQICEKTLNNFRSLMMHLRHHHPEFSSKKYYDTFFKREEEGICPLCEKITPYGDISKGYHIHCSNSCSRSNPIILKKKAVKRGETFKNNPELEKRRIENRLATIKNNPIIEERWRNNLSIAHRNYHKSLHENDSKETHYLYIMENKTKPIIKIGLCSEKSLERRTREIIGDFGKSIPVLLLKGTYKKIDELETFLHDHFNEYCKVQPFGGGRTEWFDEKIMAEAIEIASAKIEQIS